MSENLKIRSISPAVPGWWAKFTENDADRTEWYSPVAAWALCDVKYNKQKDTSEHVLPVLTSEFGMTPHHPDEGYCELLYLPNHEFVFSGETYCYSWRMVPKKEAAE
ncbi:hypothetical protein [Serratia liquefaciens]|uniref:Uncharacterized protein n=1 Tax=Serratia liquefaciens TaxID=614 RepID=A0A515D2L4_SERLI|nr:hypothetical protein [Serratia liquefaciens]QDL34654.1 hypothetical protein EGO53_24055 [Serratia liquefaciens]